MNEVKFTAWVPSGVPVENLSWIGGLWCNCSAEKQLKNDYEIEITIKKVEVTK